MCRVCIARPEIYHYFNTTITKNLTYFFCVSLHFCMTQPNHFTFIKNHSMTKHYVSTFLCLLFALGALEAQSDYSEYGGKVSIGVSILDGFGIPVRYVMGHNVAELGAYSGTIIEFQDDEINGIYAVPMIGAGYTYFGNRFLKQKKRVNKIRAHGIALRVNQILGDYSTTIPSLSWAQETFREGRTNRSFTFELGLQYAFANVVDRPVTIQNSVGIRLRCQWNFYLR